MSRNYTLEVTCNHCGRRYSYENAPDPHFWDTGNGVPILNGSHQRVMTDAYLTGFYGWKIHGDDDMCESCATTECGTCNDTGAIPGKAIISAGYYEPSGEEPCPDCGSFDIPM